MSYVARCDNGNSIDISSAIRVRKGYELDWQASIHWCCYNLIHLTPSKKLNQTQITLKIWTRTVIPAHLLNIGSISVIRRGFSGCFVSVSETDKLSKVYRLIFEQQDIRMTRRAGRTLGSNTWHRGVVISWSVCWLSTGSILGNKGIRRAAIASGRVQRYHGTHLDHGSWSAREYWMYLKSGEVSGLSC